MNDNPLYTDDNVYINGLATIPQASGCRPFFWWAR